MPAPVAAADSYTTTLNVTLDVAAPGVLANDTGGGTLTAVLVPDSALNGTATVYPDGSFTFVPTVDFIGIASFDYVCNSDNDGDSPPATVEIAVGDPLVWSHLTSGADGSQSVDGDGRGKAVWSVRADRRNRTGTEICASKKLPQRGDPLYRYKMPAGTYTVNSFYERDGDTPANANVVVVLVDAKQEANNPYLWTVTVSYEGKDDPTAELPEVSTQETEYQDYRTTDVYGQVITNSALDPFQGGMPVDDAWDSLTITRNLPYDAWNTDLKRGYRNTLNLLPFRLGNQVDAAGDPIDLPAGVVRLKRITEQRMVRSKNAAVADAQFYWRVTAELMIDQRVYRPSGGAAEESVKHRWIVADAGFNTLADGTKLPIMLTGVTRPTEPQLLNGSGGLLVNPKNTWPAVPPQPGPGYAAVAIGFHDVYSTPMNTALVVAAPGVLANDAPAVGAQAVYVTGSATNGVMTVPLAADGSFTFTPTTGFVGYAYFKYKARFGADDLTLSAETWVVIFVGAAPVLRAFERYPYKDWSDLSALLENW